MIVRIATLAAVVLSSVAAMPVAGTADGGVWVPSMVGQPQGWTTAELFDDGAGYLQRDNEDGRYLWRTTTAGAAWEPVLDLPPGQLVDFTSGDVGYAASSSALWRTTDAAGSWGELATPPVPDGRQQDIDAIFAAGTAGETVVIGLSHEALSDDGCPFNPFTQEVALAISRDGAATWDRVELLDSPGRVQQVEFVDGDFGVAIVSEYEWTRDGACSFTGQGTLGQLVYTVSRGPDGWQAELVMDCRPRVCGSVGVASPGVFTLGFADGAIAHTTDGGGTFSTGRLDHPVADGLADAVGEDNTFWVTDIEFATATIGYAVTNGRGMWRTDDGGATWTAEPSTREGYDLGIADLAVASADVALAGGPTMVVRRVPTG